MVFRLEKCMKSTQTRIHPQSVKRLMVDNTKSSLQMSTRKLQKLDYFSDLDRIVVASGCRPLPKLNFQE